jgi:UDP-2,3-diacylglucosamine hydrolase
MLPKLGILAGGGILPARLIEHCRAIGRPHYVVALDGHCDAATVVGAPHCWFRIGAAGAILAALHREGATDLVMIGRIHRPRLRDLRPDAKGWLILARIWRRFFAGDDGLLRAVAAVLEGEGFHVRGIHEVMESVLAPPGAFGRVIPSDHDLGDIADGARAARDLGLRDVGQAVVVQGGRLVAQESAKGTDELLTRAAPLLAGPGGILIKMRKPQQDRRVDLPAIGPDTVRHAAEIGLKGIAIEAGHALVLDLPEVIRLADKADLFLFGIASDE